MRNPQKPKNHSRSLENGVNADKPKNKNSLNIKIK